MRVGHVFTVTARTPIILRTSRFATGVNYCRTATGCCRFQIGFSLLPGYTYDGLFLKAHKPASRPTHPLYTSVHH